jgi:glucose-1-phosphate cytidylyltransferase
MKTVILCGGQGTRLREKTESIPKPLVEVGPYPIVWHLMKSYAAQNLNEFVLCLGYKGQLIKEYFLGVMDDRAGDFRLCVTEDGPPVLESLRSQREPWDIIFAETGLSTDTGGRVHRVRNYLGNTTFCLTYADGVSDIDIKALIDFHKSHGKIATVTAVRRQLTLGVMRVSDEDTVTNFAEKPMLDYYINGGFFVFEPEVFDYTTADCNLETDVLPKLVRDGQLKAYKHDGFWACMDTYKDNISLTELWNSGKAPWKVADASS